MLAVAIHRNCMHLRHTSKAGKRTNAHGSLHLKFGMGPLYICPLEGIPTYVAWLDGNDKTNIVYFMTHASLHWTPFNFWKMYLFIYSPTGSAPLLQHSNECLTGEPWCKQLQLLKTLEKVHLVHSVVVDCCRPVTTLDQVIQPSRPSLLACTTR